MSVATIEASIKSHLLTFAILGVLIVGGIYGVEALIAKHDAANASKYEAILAAQVAQTTVLQQQLKTDEANWQLVMAQLLAQNAQLSQTIAQRNVQNVQKQKEDASLTAQAAAQKLAQQTNAGPKDVVAGPNDDITITLPIARSIVGSLDLLPILQANLLDTQRQLSNETELFNNSQANVAEQAKLIESQKVQMVDQAKAYTAEITLVKAQARKSKLKWFGIGVIVGMIGGHIAGF